MAQTRAYKKTMNFVYGMGAAVVIIGALFKITHFQIGILTGTVMLSIGLITEALVFAISAFDTSELDIDDVPPEDLGGLLSQTLDNLLKESKIDAKLMDSLGTSITNFQGAAEGLAAAAESISSTNEYNKQVSLAAVKMESLSSLYTVQVENADKQIALNNAVVENTEKLKEQMDSLANNLSSLNGVYGGMLSAMTNK